MIFYCRFAEALILSIRGGQELLLKTQARYFQKAAGEDTDVSSVALIEAVAMGSWDKLVEHCGLDSWREVLAALVTYTDSATKQVRRLLVKSEVGTDIISPDFVCSLG